MNTENLARDKSFAFAIMIVQVYKKLIAEKKEYVLSKQLLRSGTSIGANIEESVGGQSERDFLHKLSISYKEARESLYWIRLLTVTNYLSDEEALPIKNAADEMCRILGKSMSSLKKKLNG